jgi:hypothetical protein
VSPRRAGSGFDFAAYMRQYRRDNPDYVAEQRRRSSAREKALRELGKRYPEELEQLTKKHPARSRRASEAETDPGSR